MSWASILRVVLAGGTWLMVFAGGPAASPPEKFRVGLVLGPMARQSPYDELSVAGLRRAIRELAVEGTVRTYGQKEGALPSFLYLARRGYDLVVAGAGSQAVALDLAAARSPKTRFAVLDAPYELLAHRPRNVVGVTFAAQEAGYLAGYLAGRMEKRRPGRDRISSLGGVKAPPIDDYIAGYEAGARKADPGIDTLRAYVRSFTDPARCRAAALDQIARGSGVVFPVAGACGLGALHAAGQKGVWGVGVDADQSGLGPHILTSAVKRVDVAIYEVIRREHAGRLRGGRTIEFGLREGGVGVGKVSPRVPPQIVAQVQRIERQIATGKITNIPRTVG